MRHTSVLITGAAGGIGAAIARQALALRASRLILIDADMPGLEALADEFDTSLRNALVILSARRLGCVKIYSERMAGVSVPDIEIINPFK